MIIDKENTFCDGTTFASTAGTDVHAQIGDVIDLGVGGVPNGGLTAFVNVDTVIAGTAASYFELGLQACDYTGFGTSPVMLAQTATITMAAPATTPGTRLWTCVVPKTSKRYLRLTMASTVINTGAVTAALIFDDQTNS